MKDPVVGYKKEFEELVGSLSDSIQENDPLTIGLMLYSIAEERKDTNVVMREINAKLESLTKKIDELETQVASPAAKLTGLSERDQEVLDYVGKNRRVCAEELQVKFNYRGKNAGSARLSKLFHEGRLEKEYAGRKVYYKVK